MKIKITALDRLFSLYVRHRANWRCQYCGTDYAKLNKSGLHCSHLYGRRHKSTRWHPDNAFAHCFGCHQFLGGNPVIFSKWARMKLGVARFNRLASLHRKTSRVNEESRRIVKFELLFKLRGLFAGDSIFESFLTDHGFTKKMAKEYLSMTLGANRITRETLGILNGTEKNI